MSEDTKTVGKSIIMSSVAGLILLFLVQVFALMNLKISGSAVTSTSLFVVSLIVVFLIGMLAEALTAKTKRPLVYGLAASTFTALAIVTINMLVGYVTIATMQTNVPAILNTMLSSIPMNIMTFIAMLFVSGLGALTYWWAFNKTKELSWIKEVCNESKDWKKYIVSLVVVAVIMALSYATLAYREWELIIMLVVVYIMSWLVTWLIRGIDWNKSFHVFGANLVFGVVLSLAVIIPVALGSLSRDLLALGISIVVAFVLVFFSVLWLVAYPFISAHYGMIKSFRKATSVFKKKIVQLTGELSLLYIALFSIQIVQGILAYIGWMASMWLAIAVNILISAWVLELAVMGMNRIIANLGVHD